MNKFIVLLIAGLFLSSPSLIAHFSPETEMDLESLVAFQRNPSNALQFIEQGSRYNIQGWVYVQIQGSPYERGYQYGYLLAEEIIDLMNRWSNMIHNHPNIKPLSRFLDQSQYEKISAKWWEFCKKTTTRMYWDEFPQEYKDEIQGIAAGITEKGFFLHGQPVTYQDVLASNEMYEMLSKLTDRKIRKGTHPLFSLFDMIQPDIQQYTTLSSEEFVEGFLQDPLSPPHHHCSSFIATGNATTDGQLIISNSMWSSIDGAGMWWWSYYIAVRWNILLDVIPTDGYRFQMTCAPGYIWSDHDFYQNNAGMVFIETTVPQGIWSEDGLPLAVRARSAVQYADTIDEVIRFLKTDNDGVMNAVWLIGDTKTGEIARYELGLYHDAIIERTKNGFQWSSNNPMDFWVRWEKMDWKLLIQQYLYHIVLGLNTYQYHTPWYLPAPRDIAFEELGEKYYGDIDVEVVKEIMSTDPIGTYSPDCKITSTTLVENNGIWLFTGNPGGKTLSMATFDSPVISWDEVLPVGWVRLYGLPAEHSYIPSQMNSEQKKDPLVQWMTSTDGNRNDFSSQNIVIDSVMYAAANDGYIYAIDTDTGVILWSKTVGSQPTRPVYVNHSLYIGTHDGLKKLDTEWLDLGEKPIGPIVCPPMSGEHMIFVGTQSGKVYAYDEITGAERWSVDVGSEAWISNPSSDILVVAAGSSIFGLNVTDGKIIWDFETGAVVTTQPVVSDGVVYVGSWDSYLYALDVADGSEIWKIQTGWGIETVPVVDGTTVFFGSHDGTIYAVDKTSGEIHWTFRCNAAIHSSPTVYDTTLLMGSDDGYLYCFDTLTGYLKWSFAPGRTLEDSRSNYFTTALRSNAVVKDDLVLFSAKGTFYGIKI